jgi:hypothetical protein
VWNAFPRAPGVGETSPITLTGSIDRYTITAAAKTDTSCVSRAIHFRPTHGWAYALPFENLYTPRAQRFTFLWVALLFAPLGYYTAVAVARLRGGASRAAVMLVPVAVAALSLAALPLAFALAIGTRWEWQGAGVGLAGGAVLGALVWAFMRERRHREAA